MAYASSCVPNLEQSRICFTTSLASVTSLHARKSSKEDVGCLASVVKTYYYLWQAVGNDLMFEVEVINPKDDQRDMTEED